MRRRTKKRVAKAQPEFAEVELARPGVPLMVEFSGELRLFVGDSKGVRLAAELINVLAEETQS